MNWKWTDHDKCQGHRHSFNYAVSIYTSFTLSQHRQIANILISCRILHKNDFLRKRR